MDSFFLLSSANGEVRLTVKDLGFYNLHCKSRILLNCVTSSFTEAALMRMRIFPHLLAARVRVPLPAAVPSLQPQKGTPSLDRRMLDTV